MAQVKKSLCFLVIACITLSNLVFAQSMESDFSESSIGNSEGPNDFFSPMEGIGMEPVSTDYEPNEDQLREMVREKMGNEFSEEEFQRMINSSRQRGERKESFSYEQGGFEHRYDAGPSYEGYSKERMLFAMVFEGIGDDIDPREIKGMCSEPDRIADGILSRLKAKVGDVQSLCKKIEDRESICLDSSKKRCAMIGSPSVNVNSNEMEKMQSIAFACPVNKDAITRACILRGQSHLDRQMSSTAASCEKRASSDSERMKQECERLNQNQVCDRGKFIEQCLNNIGARKDDFDESGKRKIICPKYSTPSCEEGTNLKTQKDANGCENYKCIPTSQCPPPTSPLCRDSESLQKRMDEKGCVVYYCHSSSTECPQPTQPICQSNSHVEKKVDDKGCASYYCSAPTCAEVSKPTCGTDEKLQAYYDNSGCVTGYQCIKAQPRCAEPVKPTCSEGQSLTTKYDSNNCPSYECVTVTASSSITGAVVSFNYDDYVRKCESNWAQQEKVCAHMKTSCDQTNFAERCKEQNQKNVEGLKSKIEESCTAQIQSFILAAEDKCSRMGNEKSRCTEESSKRCSQMQGLSAGCRETLTEDSIRKFITEEVRKRCKFSDKLEDREGLEKSDKAEIVLAVLNTATQSDFDRLNSFVNGLEEDLKLESTTVYRGTINPNNFGDIKLLPFVVNAKISAASSSERSKEVKEKLVASQKVEDTASKLASLRDSDVPNDYLYIIEDEASEVLNVSDNLDEIEKKDGQKGIGYKMKRFFGLAKQAEQEEIKQLQESNSKLQNSIEALTKLIDEVPSDVAKSILKEQVEDLKQQQADIQSLIDSKEKKAKGFFGIFG